MRHVSESRDTTAGGHLDIAGAVSVTLGLGGLVFSLIEIPVQGWSQVTIGTLVVGVLAMSAFPIIEHRASAPLIPLELFRSAQFIGANLVTLAVYTALGGALFLLSLQLQQSMGYSALAAGLAFVPFTAIMLLLSSRIGALTQKIGPRVLMTIGPLVTATGLVLLGRAVPGADYVTGVLPGIAVFGLGMAVTVAPLTATVLAAVPDDNVGAASGANNSISRVASLLAVAVLPLAVGLDSAGTGPLGPGFGHAMLVCAGLCAAGAAVAFLTIRRAATITPPPTPPGAGTPPTVPGPHPPHPRDHRRRMTVGPRPPTDLEHGRAGRPPFA